VDYFVIYCPELEEVYAMKAMEGVFGKLRVTPTGNNQQMFVKWAEDYLFEKHIESLKALKPHVEPPERKEWVV